MNHCIQLPVLKFLAFLSVMLTIHVSALAQERVFRKYKTQAVMAYTARHFPSYANDLVLLENAVSNYRAQNDDGRVLRIPLIFHILTPEGSVAPAPDRIRAQVDLLNRYFGDYKIESSEFPNEDVSKYSAQGSNANIQYYLAEATEMVTPLHYVSMQRKSWGFDHDIYHPSQGGIAPVDPQHYLNVYIAPLDSNAAGFAHLPALPAEVDGIVIDPDFFGTGQAAAEQYREGKTLAHLMGTYLGLYELWNDAEPCRDDKVPDTPLHDIPTTTVSTQPNTRRVCFCPGTPTTMYMNFMDNTDDAHLTLFTKGQVARMRAVLLSESLKRNDLVKK